MTTDEEFIIPASDTKGHSTRLWLRTQPSHAHQIEAVISSHKFPYKTTGDLMRHALHRHLKWLSTLAEIPSVAKGVDTIIEIVRQEEDSVRFLEVMGKVGERVSYYLSHGNQGEAIKLVMKVATEVDRMPDGYWKDRYRDEIQNRYQHLFNISEKAGFLCGQE